MSPEQARGHIVDKQTDVWAFGCVVLEMLTGRPAFGRATVTDTLAAIVHDAPDFEPLPSALPPALVRVLKRCLEKDPARRFHDIADAAFELEEIQRESADGTPATRRATAHGRRRRLAAAVAASVVLLAAIVVIVISTVRRPRCRPMGAKSYSRPRMPPGTRCSGSGISAQPGALPETDDAAHPFWSPDGKSIDGGMQPRWRADGSELFFLDRYGKMTVVPVKTDRGFEAGPPATLFQTKILPQGSQSIYFFTAYDVSPDGQRFVINGPADDPGPPITVVFNWTAARK
jgi:hypothetical protein